MPTTHEKLETAIAILRGEQDLPPQDKDRYAIARNIELFLEWLSARRYAKGRIHSVDFHSKDCGQDEILLKIITQQRDVAAGDIEWRFVKEN